MPRRGPKKKVFFSLKQKKEYDASMNQLMNFQQDQIDKLDKGFESECYNVEENKDPEEDILPTLWKQRRQITQDTQLQVLLLQQKLTYVILMGNNIQSWLISQQEKRTVSGDYDLFMINSNIRAAKSILDETELALNHNYLSTFDGWGKENTTVPLNTQQDEEKKN